MTLNKANLALLMAIISLGFSLIFFAVIFLLPYFPITGIIYLHVLSFILLGITFFHYRSIHNASKSS